VGVWVVRRKVLSLAAYQPKLVVTSFKNYRYFICGIYFGFFVFFVNISYVGLTMLQLVDT
jgi:hypothetical protein